MDWKKIGKALLFPPMATLFLLLPPALGLMLYGMLSLGAEHPVTIVGDVLSFYCLTVWCVRIPKIIAFFKNFRQENKYLRRWLSDVRLRMKVTLFGSAVWNGAYATLQLCLGIYHHSFWFRTLAGYYAALALMRLFLARHIVRAEPAVQQRRELGCYRICGWMFLVLNLLLSGMMVLRIVENRLTAHHEITTIAMAAYTFTSLTLAIANVCRYRRYQSPVFSASKAISLAAACVSMLTLEGTMLTTFQNGEMTAATVRLFLALSGGAVSAFIIAMAIYMIVHANIKIKELQNGKQ